MKTVIYNCKRCKVARRVEYPIHLSHGDYRVDSKGQHQPSSVWISACGGGKPTVYGGDTKMGICSSCGKMMTPGILKGYLKPEHVCNGICMSSRGPNCECSCGGANHGKSWAA
jgi:hypothetical protein